jgi:hypothetical protein
MNSKLAVVIVLVLIISGFFVFMNSNTSIRPALPSQGSTDQELAFDTIEIDTSSGHEETEYVVIKDEEEWNRIWDIVQSKRFPKREPPTVNFNEEMVVAVFQGNFATGGFSIEITRIVEKQDAIEIFVKEEKSAPGSFVTQAFTQPYHIVKIKNTDKEVIFK